MAFSCSRVKRWQVNAGQGRAAGDGGEKATLVSRRHEIFKMESRCQ